MKMVICAATMHPKSAGPPGELPTWTALQDSSSKICQVHIRYNTPEDNLGVIGSYQWLYENSGKEILAYLHDDVTCKEAGWNRRVLQEFDKDDVGVVGFGGGLRHGTPDIYKTPYRLQQLARSRYMSNTDDAETHGERFVGACDVAVVDGFAIIVRRSLLDRCGGWPVNKLVFHSYDYWVCCVAHELGYRVMLVGIRCHHHGGRTSITKAYNESMFKKYGKTDIQIHEESHRYIYDQFRYILPWEV